MNRVNKMKTLINWLESKLSSATENTLPIHVGIFKSMWLEEFGTEENIPKVIKCMILTKQNRRK